nr:hypothetical protein [Tanacetum cinerariifolium]
MIDQGVTAALAARDTLRSMNGNDSHNSGTGVRRTERATRECTYTDFLKCQPLPFKGTEGVASLSQWCEIMESTVGHEAAYCMSWKTLMKMMNGKYCPRNEIRKLEMELWDLKDKENQEKDKIGSKPDKNGKRGKAEKSLKQWQLKEEEKPKKTKKEWPKTHTRIKSY